MGASDCFLSAGVDCLLSPHRAAAAAEAAAVAEHDLLFAHRQRQHAWTMTLTCIWSIDIDIDGAIACLRYVAGVLTGFSF